MRKANSTNRILVLGVILVFFCSFVLKNIILGIGVFIAIFGLIIFKQKASFIASSAGKAYQKGDIDKSFALYEKAIALESCPSMTKILYAYRLINEGKVSECAKVLGTLDPTTMNDNERLNYNATNALRVWKEGGLYRAIEIYEALLNEKDSLLIYETLGYLYICAKNYKKALEFNLKALEFNNTSERIKSNLATSYYYLGYEKKAVKIYKEIIESYANFPEPYYYYGCILEAREKHKGAFKYFNMALEKKFAQLFLLTQEEVQDKINQVADYIQ